MQITMCRILLASLTWGLWAEVQGRLGGVVAKEEVHNDEDYIVSVFGGNKDFLWGAATAAAQIEGAWNVSGKQPSIWDDFCHSIPHRDTTDGESFSKTCGKIPEGQSGSKWTTLDVADDFYHRYEEDIDLLSKDYGMNSMRVSISWPRLMPYNENTGKHEANPDGIKFYKELFSYMSMQGVTPFVTLFHWDLPNDLSWLEDDVVEAFVDYANLAFDSFPEVENWATFNEPNSICSLGYAIGAFAPGHRSTTGHIICGHNLLRAHARAVKSFREKKVKGQIGIVLDYKWAYPQTDSADDKKAAEYDEDGVLGFWAEPIFLTGDYPQSVKDFFGSKMPVLSSDDKSMLKGSADFFGVNTYGGKIAKWNDKTLDEYEAGDDIAERYTFSPCNPGEDQSGLKDPKFECGAASGWLWAKPEAMRKYLEHVHTFYKVDNIYITEFGVDVDGESDMSLEEALVDTYRTEYYMRYMKEIARAADESKVPIKGIFAWSLMDNFEWGDGLNFRFGITYVDFNDLSRHPKHSAEWWTQMIRRMKEARAANR